jgi:outer membrane protein
MISKFTISIFLIIAFSTSLFAQNSGEKKWAEENWGIGMAYRYATIPFSTTKKTVGSMVPMLFFNNDLIYLTGFEYGIKFYKTQNWRFSFMGRRHFFDAPKEAQNTIQGDNVDFGLQAQYSLPYSLFLEAELLSDVNEYNGIWRGNPSANLRLIYKLDKKGNAFRPFFELKYKSEKYNSWYYGLNLVDVNSGFETSLGFIARYQLISNFYIFGAGKLTLLDKSARDVTLKINNYPISINSDLHGEVFFGIGFSNDETKPRKTELRNAGYWRLGQGFATPSTLGNIFNFEAVPDTNNNKLTSIFYGHPVSDELFGLPLDIYITPGFTWHWQSDVQPNSFELDLAIKLYYTIKWPIRWRLGAAEGISWVNQIPYMEAHSLEEKEYSPSNLMNFLDFSIDFNIGDIFNNKPMKQWWIGYYIHHRSSIFETAQHFGRISGGSNHHTIYIMWNY